MAEFFQRPRKIRKTDYLIGLLAVFALILLMIENSEYLSAYAWLIRYLNISVLFIFVFDVVARFLVCPNKRNHLKANWFDLIVFVPLLQFVQGLEMTPFFIIARQVVIITMLVSRARRANKLISMLSFRPAQLMLSSFAFAIAIGTVLLMLPAATVSGVRTPLLDALFTATSAVCVTGLIVRDTATYFSRFGQLVILSLIQVGGLGIMTFSVSLALLLRKRFDMKQQMEMRDVLDPDQTTNVKKFVLFIFKMTFLLEAFGALFLFLIWRPHFNNLFTAGYHAIFHSVSAFCNAGFSTFSDSLMGFKYDWGTNIVIGILVISGGIGFMVISDIFQRLKSMFIRGRVRKHKTKVQTKIVIITSTLLVIFGALLLFSLDYGRSFAGVTLGNKVTLSLFQSLTARTAGFNTWDIGTMSSASLLIMMLLMFIGASPGSTGGGIKTTTFSVLWAVLASSAKRKENVEMFKRTIPEEIIKKAMILVFSSLAIIFVFTVGLLYVENQLFIRVLFEVVSAFGTVGLSTGITPLLSMPGKSMLTVLMFIGRLGPLTIGYAFAGRRNAPKYTYAEERVMIG
ncbi:MAG: TrkH family potassium uptake protein [bacterium]